MEILDIEKYFGGNYPLAVEIPVHSPNPTTTKRLMVGSKCCHDNEVGHSESLLYRVSEQY